MKEKNLKNYQWCNCKQNYGHSAGTLLDSTDLIICSKCKKVCWINGKNKTEWDVK